MSSAFIFSLIASLIIHCWFMFGFTDIRSDKNSLKINEEKNIIEVSILKVLPVLQVDAKAQEKIKKGENMVSPVRDEKTKSLKKNIVGAIPSNRLKEKETQKKIYKTIVEANGVRPNEISEITKISVPLVKEVQMQNQIKRLLVKFPPVYPFLARKKGWEGEVIIVVQTDNKGNILSANIYSSSGYSILDDSAENAVKKWKFSGVKSSVLVKIPVRFVLSS